MAQHEAAAAATGEAARQKEAQRRMQPRTRADFLVLYDELAVWCAVECLGQGHVGCLAGRGVNGQCGNIGSIVSNSAFVLQCIKLLIPYVPPMQVGAGAGQDRGGAGADG